VERRVIPDGSLGDILWNQTRLICHGFNGLQTTRVFQMYLEGLKQHHSGLHVACICTLVPEFGNDGGTEAAGTVRKPKDFT
jgi:hypothetical protein